MFNQPQYCDHNLKNIEIDINDIVLSVCVEYEVTECYVEILGYIPETFDEYMESSGQDGTIEEYEMAITNLTESVLIEILSSN